MKMGKASTADMEMAMRLCTALEWLERGDMPTEARAPDEEDNDDFDSEDAEHCYRALKEVLGIVRSGSIARVVWGMYVLLDPVNKVVDQDADTLEYHPETLAAINDAKRYKLLRRGQHWSVIDGIGDTLRAESLDAAIDSEMALHANLNSTTPDVALSDSDS